MPNKQYAKTEDKHKSPGAPACSGCAVWSMFGNKCWYYWEGKKQCTVWTSGLGQF